MNKFNRLVVGSSLAVSAFAMGDSVVEAQGVNTVTVHQMSDAERDKAVLAGAITCKIGTDVLSMYGFDAPNPIVITDIQEGLIDQGYKRGGKDGKFGKYTCMEVLEFQQDEGLFIDGIVGKRTANALELNSTTASVPTSKMPNYTVIECSNYSVWSEATIKQVQKALMVSADGKFGSQSCDVMIKFQENSGIAQYGRGVLGPRTMSALGVVNPDKKSSSSSSAVFNPVVDCPTASSCEIFEDLTAQKGYVKRNDWNNQTAKGETLFTYSLQSGKPGKESSTGLFRLGSVEYGPNGNPWRLSSLGSSDGEPNLYKFRRLNPIRGGWSGEGIHGSRSFGYGSGSSGCSRVQLKDADVLARLKSNTLVLIQGIKPVRKQN